jgi:hypothetical protein
MKPAISTSKVRRLAQERGIMNAGAFQEKVNVPLTVAIHVFSSHDRMILGEVYRERLYSFFGVAAAALRFEPPSLEERKKRSDKAAARRARTAGYLAKEIA